MKVPVRDLKDIPFPKCAGDCALIAHLGCGECEPSCPEKFKELKEVGK
jgi:hypothetical protein